MDARVRYSLSMTESGSNGGWGASAPRVDQRSPGAQYVADQHVIEYVEPQKPPLVWLALSLVLSIAGLVMALVLKGATMGLVAWVVAGPLAISMVGVYNAADMKRRESGWYAPSGLADWGRRLAILLALVAVGFAAWLVANDVARGTWT